MIELAKCAVVFVLLLAIFLIWGNGAAKILKINITSLPMQILVGFFAYFLVMQTFLLPLVMLHGTMKLAVVLWLAITGAITFLFLVFEKLKFLDQIRIVELDKWCVIAIAVTLFAMILACARRYMGWDICFYIGQMQEFVHYGTFWTYDVTEGGLPTNAINLHYALSCFYAHFAVVAKVFGVSVRLIAIYVIRGLCVLLTASVVYCLGLELFEGLKRRAHFLVIVFMLMCLVSEAHHSIAYMMLVRGYESKGYCATVVCPMLLLVLIRLSKDIDSKSDWRLLWLVCWAATPVSMSAAVIVPVTVFVWGLAMMIYYRRFWSIFWRALLCVIPNVIYAGWYTISWVILKYINGSSQNGISGN